MRELSGESKITSTVGGGIFGHDFALSVLDSEARMEADHCFNIYDGKKALLVAAANQEEKIQWMEDIAEAAQVKKLMRLPSFISFLCNQ